MHSVPNACVGAALWLAVSLFTPLAAAAEPAGVIKQATGKVGVERGDKRLPLKAGDAVFPSDRIVTGPDGKAGITFRDDTLVSLGPSTRFEVDRFSYDPSARKGAFEGNLRKGRIAVVSGKIAKGGVDAMKVRTPESILGVRGTEFVVEAK